jgi:TRAP-type C4-dicarboxylate transport system substrate-binding protein
MKRLLLKILGIKEPEIKGLSEFFTNANSRDKKRIIEQAARKANQDQKDLVERYDRKYSQA